MTPKEKAVQLFDKYATYAVMWWTGGIEVENQNCKQCALIAVDEIISALKDGIDFSPNTITIDLVNKLQYWDEVKNEIPKL
jgi:hypothetical protein